MEVKINKEIRDYTESVFFGLSLRQLVFSVIACAAAAAVYFLLKDALGTETVSMRTLRGSVCGSGLHKVQRHDCGTLFYRMAQKRDNNA